MTTISLRTLLRDPKRVKRMTRTGKPVQVTDNGQPLWILQPANGNGGAMDEAERRREIEKIFQEVLRERPSRISASRILEESRR
jgi:hypothetical protein